MEWNLDVNTIFKEEITKVDHMLIPPGFVGDVRSIRAMYDRISGLVDLLGSQSASAQGLPKVITTAEKLRTADAHTLYLLKDAAGNNGRGVIVGMIKVGRKHLFLAKDRNEMLEYEPLCVLDFFVLRDYQRGGRGKKLFDYMMKDQNTTVTQLAVDGPSEMMEGFLRHCYKVPCLIRQTNNFAVAPQFFTDPANRILSADGRRARTTHGDSCGTTRDSVISVRPVATQGLAAVGRYAARPPQTSIANVIHGNNTVFGFESAQTDASQGTPSSAAAETAPAAEVAEVAPPVPVAAEVVPPSSTSTEAPLDCSVPSVTSRPSTLLVTAPVAEPSRATPSSLTEPTPAGMPTRRRDSQAPQNGVIDIKFYHTSLW